MGWKDIKITKFDDESSKFHSCIVDICRSHGVKWCHFTPPRIFDP